MSARAPGEPHRSGVLELLPHDPLRLRLFHRSNLGPALGWMDFVLPNLKGVRITFLSGQEEAWKRFPR
jgi:hypothetical protein